MSEELEQVGTGGEGIEGGAPSPDASSDGTQETQDTPQLGDDIKALIEQKVNELREQYEGPGGKIALIQSKKDKEVAAIKRQLREVQQQRQTEVKQEYERAQGLMRTDPAKAAQIMQALYESQQQAAVMENQTQQMAEWMEKVMTGYGLSPEDQEMADFAGEWFEKLIEDPDLTYDFQQAAGVRAVEAKDKEIRQAHKELKELKDGLGDLVKKEVTRLLAGAGITPSPTDDGTPPPAKDDDWRKLSSGQLIAKGLEERRRR